MFLCKKELFPYKVVVFINGKHPYLETNELDYESKDVVMTVPAKSWKDAEEKALSAARRMEGWRYSVKSISKDW